MDSNLPWNIEVCSEFFVLLLLLVWGFLFVLIFLFKNRNYFPCSIFQEEVLKRVILLFIVVPVTTLLLNWYLMLNMLSISVSLGKCSDILQIPNMGLAVIFTDIFIDVASLGRRSSQVLILNFDSMQVTMLRLVTSI